MLWNFVGTEEKRILAMINNDVDILQDITPESMQVLINKAPQVTAWHKGFPYADFDDPCERGISFNNSQFPYDQWQTRWALALATDIKNVSLGTFAGMLRVSPLAVPPVSAAVQNTYHKPLVERLTAMELPDGYKPFDPTFATEMAKIFNEQGVGGDLPKTEAELSISSASAGGSMMWKRPPNCWRASASPATLMANGCCPTARRGRSPSTRRSTSRSSPDAWPSPSPIRGRSSASTRRSIP